MTALIVIVSLTTIIIPLLVQLKQTEAKFNERWQNYRYLYETSRDKNYQPKITEQSYVENNSEVLVEIAEKDSVILRMSLLKEGKERESVKLVETN